MPVMNPGKTGGWMRLPNLTRKCLAVFAGLLIHFACSPKLFAAGAQAPGAAPAKPATKFDASKLVIAPDLAKRSPNSNP